MYIFFLEKLNFNCKQRHENNTNYFYIAVVKCCFVAKRAKLGIVCECVSVNFKDVFSVCLGWCIVKSTAREVMRTSNICFKEI